MINLLTTWNITFIERSVLTQYFERFSSLLMALLGPLTFRQERAASHSIWPGESILQPYVSLHNINLRKTPGFFSQPISPKGFIHVTLLN
jgi:hypothetical protein